MKERLKKLGVLISAIFMITVVGGQLLAGGLVDEFGFDTVGFTSPRDIDNQYWPQVPGTIFTYFAETDDGCEWNRVEVTYDEDTEIDGVDVIVNLDREWIDESDECADKLDDYPEDFPDGYGELAEITLDWYAQDDFDNIWYLGEHTVSFDTEEEECEDWTESDDVWGFEGCLDGSFESGVDGAKAGIVMLGNPSKGDFYQQEHDEDNAEDWGKVLNFVPVDESDDCLKTKEWTPLERGEIEHKYYCPDVGALLLIEEVSGGPTVVVDLIDVSSP